MTNQDHSVATELEPQTVADLIALKKFAEAQISAFARLWGPELPASRVREQLLREISIDFSFHRNRTLAAYQRSLAAFFSADEVSAGVLELEASELIHRGEDGALTPSQSAVDWFSRYIPQLMDEAVNLLQSR